MCGAGEAAPPTIKFTPSDHLTGKGAERRHMCVCVWGWKDVCVGGGRTSVWGGGRTPVCEDGRTSICGGGRTSVSPSPRSPPLTPTVTPPHP
eukprot:365222-Chlamydomonas_euryale.AAC.3